MCIIVVSHIFNLTQKIVLSNSFWNKLAVDSSVVVKTWSYDFTDTEPNLYPTRIQRIVLRVNHVALPDDFPRLQSAPRQLGKIGVDKVFLFRPGRTGWKCGRIILPNNFFADKSPITGAFNSATTECECWMVTVNIVTTRSFSLFKPING